MVIEQMGGGYETCLGTRDEHVLLTDCLFLIVSIIRGDYLNL